VASRRVAVWRSPAAEAAPPCPLMVLGLVTVVVRCLLAGGPTDAASGQASAIPRAAQPHVPQEPLWSSGRDARRHRAV